MTPLPFLSAAPDHRETGRSRGEARGWGWGVEGQKRAWPKVGVGGVPDSCQTHPRRPGVVSGVTLCFRYTSLSACVAKCGILHYNTTVLCVCTSALIDD